MTAPITEALVWCEPYGCTLMERGCARRHARSLVPAQAGVRNVPFASCVTCDEGRERAERLGVDVPSGAVIRARRWRA